MLFSFLGCGLVSLTVIISYCTMLLLGYGFLGGGFCGACLRIDRVADPKLGLLILGAIA